MNSILRRCSKGYSLVFYKLAGRGVGGTSRSGFGMEGQMPMNWNLTLVTAIFLTDVTQAKRISPMNANF